MTTAVPHPPTPAHLAATSPAVRRAQERQAALLAPLHLPRSARFRDEYGRAILASDMRPHSRLVALALGIRGNYLTGHIPERRQPGVDGLAEATGLSAGEVAVALRILEARGWLSCTRSHDDDGRRQRGTLRPHIPQHAAASLLHHTTAHHGTDTDHA